MENSKEDRRTVIIAGAGGGLGQATVRQFSELGFRVVALDIDQAGLDQLGHNVITRKIDVTDIEQVRLMINELAISDVDILVSMTGIYHFFPVTEADPALFRRIMEVNLQGTVNMINALMPMLVRNKGRVIVVSSESYKIQAMFQPYMISKAALEAYSLSARQELALKGVKLSVIRPGAIQTPLLKWMEEEPDTNKFAVYGRELLASFKASVSMVKKPVTPELVASMIIRVATSRNPRRVYRINNSKLLNIIALLPKAWFDRLVVGRFRE